MRKTGFTCIIQSHSTTWHDGSVALILPTGKLYALVSERVGKRQKHGGDSGEAYEYLKTRLTAHQYCFGSRTDFFKRIDQEDFNKSEHHLYHAASTFFGSPFSEAAVLVIDGQGPQRGQWVATTLWAGQRNKLRIIETFYPSPERFVPQSIGHFYTAIGALAGMRNLYDEGKTMGLASYGRPSRYIDFFKRYVYSRADGSFHITPAFIYAVLGNTFGPRFYDWGNQPPDIQEIWEEILSLRGTPLRKPDENFSQDDMDIAYAGQLILDEIVVGLARRAKELTGIKYLCLAGGVALNCTTNARVIESGLFKQVYIFPAADDSGQSLGKLFHYLHSHDIKVNTKVGNVFLGPEYSARETRAAFQGETGVEVLSGSMQLTIVLAASRLANGQVLGWFQGRSEIGPRALGHRSILADPRRREMRDYINSRVKHREWYRPVAPVVLEEEAGRFFLIDCPSPFMLVTAKVRPDKTHLIPAVVHIDGSARIQTLKRSQEPRLYRLIEQFRRLTGIPIVVNTSFNSKDEPIVETPNDAVQSFLRMNLDALVLDKYLLVKRKK